MTHAVTAASRHRSGLAAALGISAGLLVLELAIGLLANSLALLADAGHMFADVSGIAISLAAIRVARRAPTSERSFGLYRLEIVAASVNALLLLGISVAVLWEAIRRLLAPPEVDPGLIAVVAAVALAANLVSLRLLSRGRHESLTVRGAYLEVLGDVLGSGAVLAAGVTILATGFLAADAIASLLIGLLILPRTWALFRDSVDVLLEATPRDVDLEEVRRHILEAPGVRDVHDLHAWTITSGMNVVSAHVVMGDEGDPGQLLDHLGECLSVDFDIDHSTFQLETPEHVIWEGRASRTQHPTDA
jgi:cobalt-zinc-cadmium efflux system protein